MKKSDVESFFLKKGLKQDSYGHFKTPDGMIRYKMQATSMRKERKLVYESGGSDWLRVWGGYYKDLYINENGKLALKKSSSPLSTIKNK